MAESQVPHDTRSLLIPRFQRSEISGFVAGIGTTFAAVPDLVAMLRRRSSAGMNPRMAAIMGVLQILWVYYGLLIASRARSDGIVDGPSPQTFEALSLRLQRGDGVPGEGRAGLGPGA